MNKNLSEMIAAYGKKTKRSGTRPKISKVKNLPSLSHNTSATKIKPSSSSRSGHCSKVANKELPPKPDLCRYSKIKSFSSMDEDFDKLEFISHKHQLMRNNSLSIQQRLIEIASNSKLPTIKEVNSSFTNEKRFNEKVDSLLQRYQETYRQKLRIFEGFSSNL